MGWWHNDRCILHTFSNIKGSIIAMATIIFVLKTCCQIKNIRICCILNASVPWYIWLNFHTKSYIGCGVSLQGKWRSNKPEKKWKIPPRLRSMGEYMSYLCQPNQMICANEQCLNDKHKRSCNLWCCSWSRRKLFSNDTFGVYTWPNAFRSKWQSRRWDFRRGNGSGIKL